MDSRNSAGVERKIEHRLFLLSVWTKGIAGLVETIGGLLLLFVPQTGLRVTRWRIGTSSRSIPQFQANTASASAMDCLIRANSLS